MKVFALCMACMIVLAGCRSAPTKTTDSPAIVAAPGISEISPQQALPAISAAYSQFIDVRSPEEYATGHAYRTRNLPLDTLADDLDKLEKEEPVYIICRTDNRSRAAAKLLVDAGFKQAVVITGGAEAWKAAGLPMGNAEPTSGLSRLDERTQRALIAALADERRAEATYRAVLKKYPDARPFVNIVDAEKQHQEFLLVLFARYGLAVPHNEFDAGTIAVPETLTEACKAGIKAENENIALYDGFFGSVKETDIRDVFERLQAASRDNHLPAFIRCAEGRGPGRGPDRRGPQ